MLAIIKKFILWLQQFETGLKYKFILIINSKEINNNSQVFKLKILYIQKKLHTQHTQLFLVVVSMLNFPAPTTQDAAETLIALPTVSLQT